MRSLALFLSIFTVALGAQAEVVRCTDASGAVSYTNVACPPGSKRAAQVQILESPPRRRNAARYTPPPSAAPTQPAPSQQAANQPNPPNPPSGPAIIPRYPADTQQRPASDPPVYILGPDDPYYDGARPLRRPPHQSRATPARRPASGPATWRASSATTAERAMSLNQTVPVGTPTPAAMPWTVHCDGSAMPNPGRMGIGAVITAPDGTRHTLSQATHTTGCNNEAELLALTLALQDLRERGATAVRAFSDNSILVEQLGAVQARPIARLAGLFDDARRCSAASTTRACNGFRATATARPTRWRVRRWALRPSRPRVL
jgi:ribonuclease HI